MTMSVRAALPFAIAALCALALPAGAAEFSPEQVAKIRHEEKAALKKVDEAHGNKKPGEMDNEERRKVIEEKAVAAQAVYEKNGVSAKDFVQYSARMSREDQARAKAEEQRLEEKAKAEAAKQTKPDEGAREIPIQQGFDDEYPGQLEHPEGAATEAR